jgi:hypothetical protein
MLTRLFFYLNLYSAIYGRGVLLTYWTSASCKTLATAYYSALYFLRCLCTTNHLKETHIANSRPSTQKANSGFAIQTFGNTAPALGARRNLATQSLRLPHAPFFGICYISLAIDHQLEVVALALLHETGLLRLSSTCQHLTLPHSRAKCYQDTPHYASPKSTWALCRVETVDRGSRCVSLARHQQGASFPCTLTAVRSVALPRSIWITPRPFIR